MATFLKVPAMCYGTRKVPSHKDGRKTGQKIETYDMIGMFSIRGDEMPTTLFQGKGIVQLKKAWRSLFQTAFLKNPPSGKVQLLAICNMQRYNMKVPEPKEYALKEESAMFTGNGGW